MVIQKTISNHTNLIIRIVLSLAFLGHGLVSLGYSPSFSLHYNLIDAINFSSIETNFIVKVQAWFDIMIAGLFILNYKIRAVIYAVLCYLTIVCISALALYSETTGSIFGISECLRRFPWIFLTLYLLFELNGKQKFHFIRIALSFAFIAHGLASLGFLGLNQGHIDLAIKVVSEDYARLFVTCSGFTDTIIGLMLLQGILTRYVAVIGMLWILFIVYLSYLTAIPDAIFRIGFLLTAIYVVFDSRCYLPKLISYEKK